MGGAIIAATQPPLPRPRSKSCRRHPVLVGSPGGAAAANGTAAACECGAAPLLPSPLALIRLRAEQRCIGRERVGRARRAGLGSGGPALWWSGGGAAGRRRHVRTLLITVPLVCAHARRLLRLLSIGVLGFSSPQLQSAPFRAICRRPAPPGRLPRLHFCFHFLLSGNDCSLLGSADSGFLPFISTLAAISGFLPCAWRSTAGFIPVTFNWIRRLPFLSALFRSRSPEV